MKKIKYIFMLLLVAFFSGCGDDDFDSGFLDNAGAPANISALFTITQDNTGLVTILPNGEGVVSYTIDYGDSSEAETIGAGQKAQHNYAEGVYNVTITANGINGKQTIITEELTVTFRAPEDLAVAIATVNGDPYTINVSATALYETFYSVTFGEDETAEPVDFNEGDVVSHTYAGIGTYEVKVIAYSGGAATTEYTQQVTITDPLVLPLTFESSTLNYAFGDFGGAATSVIDNPDATGINTSNKVGRLVKNAGAEVWAGTSLALDETIDFSEMQQFRLKVWSPAAGIPVTLKLENIDNADINHEVQVFTTVANEWEYLIFNFSEADLTQDYGRIVLFFNLGANGTGETYYFDDLEQTYGDFPLVLPITFENGGIDYAFTNFGSALSEVVDNPNPGGINTSGKVGKFHKPATAETWGGSFLDVETPIDFSSMQKIRVKVWSPAAGVPVLLKLENISSSAIFMEVQATTTVANEWEELVFDFSGGNTSEDYQRLVFFFDFGNNGTTADYYFDDIELTN